ncbi:MAG: alpha-L-rhamnosidase C-terminal domain-containing protein [Bacteroidales bacterium]|nr:alpha-L-rhamnosidase C-terminal domain-containing protein [Bacteroidales bacterium]
MRNILFLLLFVFGFSNLSAKVIYNMEKAEPGSWFCFRKDINIDGDPSKAVIRLAADSKYWLWVNGELVVYEGGLKRGPNPKDTYCDVISDIKPLKKGKNNVTILLWYFGKEGFSHRSSDIAGIDFTLTCGKQKIDSDESWKSIKHPSFFVPTKESPNFRLAESNIGYDANKGMKFFASDYDDSNWDGVKTTDLVSANWNNLVDRPIPFWKDYGLNDYTRVEKKGNQVIGHLPYNCQLTPYIKLKAKAGKEIEIKTDNYNGGGTPNVYSVYITKDGEQEFETPGWMNGHEVIYNIPDDVEVIGVKYRETGYNCDFTGNFVSDDKALNTLWLKSQRTLYITMRDNYMDCPDRERAQWWGDAVNELGEAFYALDPNAHLLTRKAIHELMDWQRADSTIFSPIPAGNWDQELPMQMMASVGYYGFWTYYLGTGDKKTIEDVYDNVTKYVKMWKIKPDGLVTYRPGAWDWGDWGENADMKLLCNLWYSVTLKGYREMALLLGKKDDANWALKTDEALTKAFNEQFWNGKYYIHPEHNGLPDDRTQAMAVVARVVPKENYPIIRKFISGTQFASPYMEKYVLQALCDMGYYQDALDRMRDRYKYMIESPITTLWEGWDRNQNMGWTYNHAWSGGPLTILSQYIAGIETVKPGFKEFKIKPQMCDLNSIRIVVPSVNGNIEASLKKTDKSINYEVMVPQKSEALLYLPKSLSSYQVNGKSYSSKKLSKFNSDDSDFYVIKLKGGVWSVNGK